MPTAVWAAYMLGLARPARGSRGEVAEAGQTQSGNQNARDCSNETKHPFPEYMQIFELKYNLNPTGETTAKGKEMKAEKGRVRHLV